MFLAQLKVKSFVATGVRARYLRLKTDLPHIINTPTSLAAHIGAPQELRIAIKANSQSALALNLKP
jgi:hypothetical protein